jgi:hypothetical protein
MKNSMLKIIALLFIATIFSSCTLDMFNKVNGNRNVITQVRKTSDAFSGVKVSTGLNLIITQGQKNKVKVEADENLHDIIITEVEDGILRVYSEKNIWRAKAKKVYVTVKDLTLLKAISGSDVSGKGTMKSDEITITASSGASIRVVVAAQSVVTKSSSGAQIRIEGTTEGHTSSASSGSSIDAFQLISKSAIAKVSSGAAVDIYASEKIDAKASSGGSVNFKGNPQSVAENESSGGSVSAR